MALVTMKRLSVLAPAERRRPVLRRLARLGCAELERAAPQLFADTGGALRPQEENTGAAEIRARLTAAHSALAAAAPQKTPFFGARMTMTERQLFDSASLEAANRAAAQIEALVRQSEEASASISRIEARIASLRPWIPLDLPLNYTGSEHTEFWIGVLPVSCDLEALRSALAEQAPASQLDLVGSDREQHYMTLLVHKGEAPAASALVRASGFTAVPFRDVSRTAGEEISSLEAEEAAARRIRETAAQSIASFAPERQKIAAAIDAYTMEALRDSLLSGFGRTERTVYLTGWIPADAAGAVEQVLREEGCAYELREPAEGEDPPTAYRDNRFVEPFAAVTEMYGTPTYGSIIDPNPLMSFFYFIFFGFIMADAMYGLLMFFGCWFYLKKKRPAGTMKRMLTLFMSCGISTFAAGGLTGGWFGDLASAVSGGAFTIPAIWFEPLTDPMKMLAFSLALGALQIIIGMGLSAWRSIRQGQLLDAVFDVGSWYVLFLGIGLFALGLPVGGWLMGIGLLMLLLTGGRKNKGLGKIIGGLGKIYNITGFLSDLLSYSRVMALGLSGAVVGQVVNKIATMATGIPGVILFVAVFLFGHIFNLAIGLLGAYVHTSRLQYIEFFGRFFEDGGHPFKPLENNTKFVEIVKED